MTMCFSSHHHFLLCLFLLSFLCVNSQSSYVVILRNGSPNHVVTEICYVHEGPDGEKILLKPGMSDHVTTTIIPGYINKLTCRLELGYWKYVELFKLFDLNDMSICQNPSEECLWMIQEDGLCMFSKKVNVMFR